MFDLPWYKKCLGYLMPIVTQQLYTDKHAALKIKYYQGQWQLESAHALYSDGYRYSPFKLAFERLDKKNKLQPIQHFLLLGAGLGSALSRLHTVYQLFPRSVLVEYDEKIIELAKQYHQLDQDKNVFFEHYDAADYIRQTQHTFDMIGIDLFKDLENSQVVQDPNFWHQIIRISSSDARIIINTIFLHKNDRRVFEDMLSTHFTFDRIERSPNYIYLLFPKVSNG